jgi:hypothetical protein
MNKFLKFSLIYTISFVLIFTLNAALSMDETHGFFYLTPAKLLIRLVIAALITVNLYYRLDRK